MHKITTFVALLFSFLLIVSVGGCFAATGQKDMNNNIAAKNPAPSTPATQAAKNNSSARSDVLASPETIKGTIAFTGNPVNEVTLIGADGTPYDFCITRKSKLDLDGKKISPPQVQNEEHKEATVRFLPTANGNMVLDLNVGAS